MLRSSTGWRGRCRICGSRSSTVATFAVVLHAREERYPRDHAFMAAAQRLKPEEIERPARLFVGLGVRKVRLTGGEPLLRRDLPEIISRLAALPVADLALTSNGALFGAGCTACQPRPVSNGSR